MEISKPFEQRHPERLKHEAYQWRGDVERLKRSWGIIQTTLDSLLLDDDEPPHRDGRRRVAGVIEVHLRRNTSSGIDIGYLRDQCLDLAAEQAIVQALREKAVEDANIVSNLKILNTSVVLEKTSVAQRIHPDNDTLALILEAVRAEAEAGLALELLEDEMQQYLQKEREIEEAIGKLYEVLNETDQSALRFAKVIVTEIGRGYSELDMRIGRRAVSGDNYRIASESNANLLQLMEQAVLLSEDIE